MDNVTLDLDNCLEEAKAFHGGLCGGIAIGTRMAVLGMNAVGITDPKGNNRKDLMVFVEMDRCATDAILAVTGCQPGKRTMKILNYGKMAATFINLKTRKAIRISQKNLDGDTVTTREMIEQNPQTTDFLQLSDDELFDICEVEVDLNPEDMPGRPLKIVTCSKCGERVMDLKEITKDGKYFCKPCAENSNYYRNK
ncbi:MAG: formylmethanofuran dehydrogenase [Spirochaetes bacterium]|nr:formylmethanofuran dehydrogenase [Spirochaetota bacterium]